MANNSILAKMLVFISANNAEFNKSFADSAKTTKNFQANIVDLNKTLAAFGIGFGIYEVVKGLKSAANTAIEFEKTMSEVRAITGATGRDFQALEQDALRLGAATKFSATEVGQLQVAYGRLGFTTREILAATGATLDLAAATGEDLAKSADVAGSTVRGFGLAANQTQRVVDVMASSFNKTALGLDNFAEAMKYVAPDAAAAGASIEETTALLGTLADAGIRGSQAGTSLRKIFSEMTKDGRPLAERLSELSKRGLTLADAYDEVGRTAQTSLLILTKNEAKSRELAAAFQNVAGEAAKMARVMADNAAGDLDKLSSAWEGLVLKFTNTAWMRRVTQEFTQFIASLSGDADMDILLNDLTRQIQAGRLPSAINALITKLSELRKAAGKPIDIAIASELAEKYNLTDEQAEKLYTSILKINESLSFQESVIKLFNEFAVRNGYKDLSKAADDYKKRMYELIVAQQIQKDDLVELQKINNSPDVAKQIKRSEDDIKRYHRVIELINEYMETATASAKEDPLKGVGAVAFETLQSLEDQLKLIRSTQKQYTATSDIKTLQKLEKQAEAVQAKIDRIIQKILGLDNINVDMLIDIKSPTLDKITGINTGSAQLGIELPPITMKPIDSKYFEASLESLQNNVRGFVSKTKEMVDVGFAEIAPSITSSLSGIGEAIGSALSGSENFGKSLLKVLGGVLTQLGQMLISVGVGILAFKKSLVTLNPYVAIAAGVALIALGSYTSSKIQATGANPTGTSAGSPSRTTEKITGSLVEDQLEIEVGGEFRIQGPDLVAVLNRQNQLNKRTRG